MFHVSMQRAQAVIVMTALVALAAAAPAFGQTGGARPVDDDERPPYSRWHFGALSGPQEVGRTGITAGGELGIRLRRYVHLVIEGGWMSDVVTQSRLDELDGYVDYVKGAYGVPVTGDIDGPAWFGLAGVQVIPDGKPAGESGGVRPYLIATAGLARVEYKPGFTVDGQPVTGAGLVLYGVELGRDLLGTTYRFAYSGGAGIKFGDRWYLDLGVRVMRINTSSHPTTVKRAVIGMGRRF